MASHAHGEPSRTDTPALVAPNRGAPCTLPALPNPGPSMEAKRPHQKPGAMWSGWVGAVALPTLIISSMMCTSKPSQSPQGLRILHRSCKEGTAFTDTHPARAHQHLHSPNGGGWAGTPRVLWDSTEMSTPTQAHGSVVTRAGRVSEVRLQGCPRSKPEAHLAAPAGLEEMPTVEGTQRHQRPRMVPQTCKASHDPKPSPMRDNRPELPG